MATVTNKGNPIEPIDPPLTTHNRTVAADPNGSTTPAFSGEIVFCTATESYWKAMSTDNAAWVQLTVGI